MDENGPNDNRDNDDSTGSQLKNENEEDVNEKQEIEFKTEGSSLAQSDVKKIESPALQKEISQKEERNDPEDDVPKAAPAVMSISKVLENLL